MSRKTDIKRIFGLDLLRALAVLLVVFTHGKFLLNDSPLEGFPYLKMIDGVDMFFVLSGFLIGGIILRQFGKEKVIKVKELLVFWKYRWFRTLPLYYLILSVDYFLVANGLVAGSTSHVTVDFLFFTQNLYSSFIGFFWESWSLSVEEWFYLISPLFIYLLTKVINVKWAFLLITLLMILFPLFYRYGISDPEIGRFFTWDITFRKVVLCRFDSIGYGMLAAWIYLYHRKTWTKFKYVYFALGVALMVLLINYKTGLETFYIQVLVLSLSPISVMLALPLISTIKKGSGVFATSVQFISKISYSMYLVNLGIVAALIKFNFPPTGGADSVFKYGVYWLSVIVLSSILYHFVEQPVLKLRVKPWKRDKRNMSKGNEVT